MSPGQEELENSIHGITADVLQTQEYSSAANINYSNSQQFGKRRLQQHEASSYMDTSLGRDPRVTGKGKMILQASLSKI